MKIDKIKDDKDKDTKFKLRIRQVRKGADMLERSDIFDSLIKSLRKNNGIPAEGFSEDEASEEFIKLITDVKKLEQIIKECEYILPRAKLPYIWIDSIVYFSIHNMLLVPVSKPMEIHSINDKQFMSLSGLTIVITEELSKREFHDAIDKNWNSIKNQMSHLNKTPTHRMIRSELARRITRLRDEKHLTFGKIADLLVEEMIDTEEADLINEDYVKNLYHRWKIEIK